MFNTMKQAADYIARKHKRDPSQPIPEVEEVGTVAGVTIHFVRFEGRVWKECVCSTI